MKRETLKMILQQKASLRSLKEISQKFLLSLFRFQVAYFEFDSDQFRFGIVGETSESVSPQPFHVIRIGGSTKNRTKRSVTSKKGNNRVINLVRKRENEKKKKVEKYFFFSFFSVSIFTPPVFLSRSLLECGCGSSRTYVWNPRGSIWSPMGCHTSSNPKTFLRKFQKKFKKFGKFLNLI